MSKRTTASSLGPIDIVRRGPRSDRRLWARAAGVLAALCSSLVVGGTWPGHVAVASAHPSVPPRAASVHLAAAVSAASSQLAPASVAPPAPPAPQLASRRVVLYGDSLAWESQAFFTSTLAAAGITQVTTRTMGGTAICDALPSMRADAATPHSDAVVVEFSGNAFTPCMRDASGQPLTGAAFYAKYVADAEEVISIFAGSNTVVYFAGAPMSRPEAGAHDPYADLLNHMYASMAAGDARVRYIDAGAAVLDHGKWTETRPCLPNEPCTGGPGTDGHGVNVVRASDGHHFCPEIPPAVAGVVAACAVWNSGAFRYGTAMAVPVLGDLEQVSAYS